jgi:hypothetical protein
VKTAGLFRFKLGHYRLITVIFFSATQLRVKAEVYEQRVADGLVFLVLWINTKEDKWDCGDAAALANDVIELTLIVCDL